MKLKAFLVFILLLCGLIGVLFFLLQKKWLLVQFTFSPTVSQTSIFPTKQNSSHKKSKIFYWKNERWHNEEVTLIWQEDNIARNLKQLVKQWTLTLQEEKLLSEHINLESAIVSSVGNEAYLSFDRSLFSKEWSIMQKWLIIESLFKAIQNTNLALNNISFLVHDKIMEDDHLTFSHPLPIQEFCS